MQWAIEKCLESVGVIISYSIVLETKQGYYVEMLKRESEKWNAVGGRFLQADVPHQAITRVKHGNSSLLDRKDPKHLEYASNHYSSKPILPPRKNGFQGINVQANSLSKGVECSIWHEGCCQSIFCCWWWWCYLRLMLMWESHRTLGGNPTGSLDKGLGQTESTPAFGKQVGWGTWQA